MRVVAATAVSMLVLFSSGGARAEDGREGDDGDKAPSLATSGLVVFLGSYAAAAALTASYRDHEGRTVMTMLVPVAGPWMTLARGELDANTTLTGRMVSATGANECEGDPVICPGALPFIPVAILEYAFVLFDPIAQATGIVMAFAGAATAEKKLPKNQPEPVKISVRPTLIAGGPGMSLSVTRW